MEYGRNGAFGGWEDTLKTYLLATCLIAGVVLFAIPPMAYWVLNPELSHIQVFLDKWPWIVLGGGLMAAGAAVVR